MSYAILFVDIAYWALCISAVAWLAYRANFRIGQLKQHRISGRKWGLLTGIWLTVFVLAATGIWTAKMAVFAETVEHYNRAERDELEQIVGAPPVDGDLLRAQALAIIREQEAVPHQEALNAFDDAMAKESEKIKTRN